jgi:hypothetical protein
MIFQGIPHHQRWRSTMAFLLGAIALGAPSASDAMDGYVNRKRPLVVFSPSESHPNLVRQRNLINGQRTGVSDRDMVVVYVIGQTLRTDFGANPRTSASALRSRYRVSEGQFRVLLIGKDGGVKRESETALPVAEIFAEIDRMPMRREEVRRKSDRQ